MKPTAERIAVCLQEITATNAAIREIADADPTAAVLLPLLDRQLTALDDLRRVLRERAAEMESLRLRFQDRMNNALMAVQLGADLLRRSESASASTTDLLSRLAEAVETGRRAVQEIDALLGAS